MIHDLFQVLPKEQHEHRNAGPGRACVRTRQGEPGGATAARRRRTRCAANATRLPFLPRHRADGVHRRPLRPSLRLRHATARYILQGTFDGALRDLAVAALQWWGKYTLPNTVVPVMNGHPRDQAKVSVHCRWLLIRGNLTLKCVGLGIDNVAVQGRWPLTTGVAQGRYYCTTIYISRC